LHLKRSPREKHWRQLQKVLKYLAEGKTTIPVIVLKNLLNNYLKFPDITHIVIAELESCTHKGEIDIA
jgi:hypothetical protein